MNDPITPLLQVCLALELVGFDAETLEHCAEQAGDHQDFLLVFQLDEDRFVRLSHDSDAALLTVAVSLAAQSFGPAHAILALQANHVLDARLGHFCLEPVSGALCLTRPPAPIDEDLELLARLLLEMQHWLLRVHEGAKHGEVSARSAEAVALAHFPVEGLMRV